MITLKILSATAQNLVTRPTGRPRFVRLWCMCVSGTCARQFSVNQVHVTQVGATSFAQDYVQDATSFAQDDVQGATDLSYIITYRLQHISRKIT